MHALTDARSDRIHAVDATSFAPCPLSFRPRRRRSANSSTSTPAATASHPREPKTTVAFSTSEKGDIQRYRIDMVRAVGADDSTLYIVTYRGERGTSDFAFWVLPPALIRFKNSPETVWTRTALSLPSAGKP